MSKEGFEEQQQREIDEIFGMSYEDGNRLEWLLRNAAIPEHIERRIYQGLYRGHLSHDEGMELIDYLEKNQRDSIDGGFNYQQTDIKWKLKNTKDEKK